MSSSRQSIRAALACFALALPVAGCFQPLYGACVGGVSMAQSLASITVTPIPDRLGYYLTNELTFAFYGGGAPVERKYRLTITLHERVQTPLVDTVSGRATAAIIGIDADYRLTAIDTGAEIDSGTAFVTEDYDRSSQRFANIRAARDAEIRGAKVLADQIRTRIAAKLASKG